MDSWKTEAKRWYEDALEDLEVAKDLLRTKHYASSCFHSQQAGEKALKAALYALKVEARGHSLTELMKLLSQRIGRDLSNFEEDVMLLDKHYSPPRYPNLHPGINLPAHKLYSKRDAEGCLKSSEKIIKFVKELLEEFSVL